MFGDKFVSIRLQFIKKMPFIMLQMPNNSLYKTFSISDWKTVETDIPGKANMYALKLHLSNKVTEIYFTTDKYRKQFTNVVLSYTIYNKAKEKKRNLNNSTFNNRIRKFENTRNRKLIKTNGNTPTIDENALQEFLNFGTYGGKANKYIKLQKGGKRLIRTGPKGGKYYMKGGNKVYIK
tara:strand:- start:88 stop:624 length:537 start_codon:yes stop_codon:yes gene_type:complete